MSTDIEREMNSLHTDLSDQFVNINADDQLEDFLELLEFLGRIYGANEPVFGHTEHGNRLRATWRLIFGEPAQITPGEWERCGGCGGWYVNSVGEHA